MLNKNEHNYLSLLYNIINTGEDRQDRTGVGTISIFGAHTVYNLEEGFPLLTTKKMFWRGIIEELLWFCRGETNIQSLTDKNINIWNEWADDDGELGPIYGKQWRKFPKIDGNNVTGHIDQLEDVVSSIKNNPLSRRHIVSAWNPGELHNMMLPPCHMMFQFYVRGEYLDCQLYQRSADMFLGVPFNIASYSVLLCIIAIKAGLLPGRFLHCIGDAHIYLNHIEQVKQQLYERSVSVPPEIWVDPVVENLKWEDIAFAHFKLSNYNHAGTLTGDIAK